MLKVIDEFFNGGVKYILPEARPDHRGEFFEAYNRDELERLGVYHKVVQLNQSWSRMGTIRGLHFQFNAPMAKMMRVVRGKGYLIAVDIRIGSPSFGKANWMEVTDDLATPIWMYAEAGFARGLLALGTHGTVVEYLCNAQFNPLGESGISYLDKDIDIPWHELARGYGVTKFHTSEKDKQAQSLRDWVKNPQASIFSYSD